VSSNIRAFAKNMYDGIRGRGNTHATAVERVVGALPMLVPEAGASELEAAAVHVRGLERTQQAPAVMQGEAPFTSWFDPARKPGWIRWQRYRRYLLENKGWAFDSVAALDESSDEIVKQLGIARHDGVRRPARTGRRLGAVGQDRQLHGADLQGGRRGLPHGDRARGHPQQPAPPDPGPHRRGDHRRGVQPWGHAADARGRGSARADMAEHPSINSLTGRGEDGDFSVQVARRVAVNPGETPLLLVVKKNVVVLEHLISYLRGLSTTVPGRTAFGSCAACRCS
jgi:hypothetical protein